VKIALLLPVKYRCTFVMVPFIWPFDRGYVVTQDFDALFRFLIILFNKKRYEQVGFSVLVY
jgi:hypothetical protein